MKTFYSINNYKSTKPTIVTIGTFDGVHIGHQKILQQLIALSKDTASNSVLLTFFPHPRMVLQKESNVRLINTVKEKILLLEKKGIDILIIQPFDKEFSNLTALEFVRDILVEKLHVSKLVIGYDHHFGKNREGNITQLRAYAKIYNFEIIEIPAQDIEDVSISSTKIREALHNGNIEIVNSYLGSHFTLQGAVVRGNRLGKKIGFPTANIAIEEDYKLIPRNGSYIVEAIIENKKVYGMMNIGIRPTIKDCKKTIEIHFLDFDKDLYGKTLSISLLKRLRDEKRFDSIENLQKQLKKDKKEVESYIQTLSS